MSVPTCDDFFSRFPTDEFTIEEQGLLDALQQILTLCAPGEAFPLLQWMEMRAANELAVLRVEGDAIHFSGEILQRQYTGEVPFAPKRTKNDRISAFFAKLPADHFQSAEQTLHDVIIETLIKWSAKEPPTLNDVLGNAHVRAARGFLPKFVPVRQWLSQRMGGEVQIRENDIMELMADTRVAVGARRGRERNTAKTAKNADEFFAALPASLLSDAEVTLRDAIFTGLVNGSPQGERLSKVLSDPRVRAAADAFIPASLHVRLWIEQRLSAEIKLQEGKGDFRIAFTPDAIEKVKGKRTEIIQSKTAASFDQNAAKLPENAFLPSGELSSEELDLAQALIDWTRETSTKTAPMLAMACKDPEIVRLRTRANPEQKKFKFRDWIEQRLPHEIELCDRGNGQVGLILIEDRDYFFESLPLDSLSDVENNLRAALYEFLQGWSSKSPPSFKDANAGEVQRCLNALFVHGNGSSESLRLWIDRRIGAEISTQKVGDRWTLAVCDGQEAEAEDYGEEEEEEISGEELLAMQKRLQERKRKAEL